MTAGWSLSATSATWALLVPAILLAPARARRRAATDAPGGAPAASASGDAPGRPASRVPVLHLVAAAAVVVAGTALAGLSGLVLGGFAAPAVVLGARRLERRQSRPIPADGLPLTLDLAAAALRTGRPPADALRAAALSADPATRDALLRVAALLRLGADPRQAWASSGSDALAPVAAVAARSATSGVRLASAFCRLATELRAERIAWATARAHRAGVLAMAPLGACFLPSFVCLGVVPVVVGIAGTVLGAVR